MKVQRKITNLERKFRMRLRNLKRIVTMKIKKRHVLKKVIINLRKVRINLRKVEKKVVKAKEVRNQIMTMIVWLKKPPLLSMNIIIIIIMMKNRLKLMLKKKLKEGTRNSVRRKEKKLETKKRKRGKMLIHTMNMGDIGGTFRMAMVITITPMAMVGTIIMETNPIIGILTGGEVDIVDILIHILILDLAVIHIHINIVINMRIIIHFIIPIHIISTIRIQRRMSIMKIKDFIQICPDKGS